MKKLKAGAVNSISFIKSFGYNTNSFNVTFEKVVGGTTLALTNLQDNLGLDSCSDFIVLNLDLISNNLEGGEYYMTVSNESTSSTYLCEVESYSYQSLGNSIYSDSVVLGGPDLSDLEPQELFASEQIKLFFATDLADAQSKVSSVSYDIFLDTGYNMSLTDLLNGNIKLYAYSDLAGDYVYYVGSEVLSNPNSFVNALFTAGFGEPDHYSNISLPAGIVTEVQSFDAASLFPIFGGLNGAEIYLQAAITKTDYIKPDNYAAVINPSLDVTPPYPYSRQPAWVRNSDYQSSTSGARISLGAAPVNDDL